MKLSLCTISFRHHLLSITDIASWAQRNQFQGIELWGIHALNLADQPQFNAGWLENYDLQVPMISDYLPVTGSKQAALDKVDRLCELAWRWNCQKIRTFAGQHASHSTNAVERQHITTRLRALSERAWKHGVRLIVETHPNTLADNTASTLQLLRDVNHPGLAINFDVLHLWEAGDDLLSAWQQLQPYTEHMHLKNIRSADLLNVFMPENVYAAAGNREGMVPLFEGALDYQALLMAIAPLHDLDASLEWFGHDAQSVLQHDCRQLHRLFSLQQQAANVSQIPAAGKLAAG
jgi:3-dehydroshikimate dehydratase